MQHKSKKSEAEHSGDNVIEHNGEIGEPTSDILDMTRRLLDLENKYTEAKKIASDLYDEYGKLEMQLYERMKNVGIDQFRTSEFGLISCGNTLYGKIVDSNAAETWFKENGMFDDIMKLTPKKARLNELIKTCLQEGKSIPPGLDYSLTRTIRHKSA